MSYLIYERIMSLLGLAGLWALWYYLWKPQRVDAFREELFELRDSLFDLAADGVVSFNHPAYTQLRLLINGMIRFAHRLTLPLMIVAAISSRHTPPSEYAAWQASVQELPEGARRRLLAIHTGVFKATTRQVVSGSPVLWACVAIIVALSGLRTFFLRVMGRTPVNTFTDEHVGLRVSWEGNRVTIAATKAIEARVLHDEHKRTHAKDEHAYAQ